jgi:hypothetical protein
VAVLAEPDVGALEFLALLADLVGHRESSKTGVILLASSDPHFNPYLVEKAG